MHGRAEPLRQFRKQGDASLRVEETAVTLKDGHGFRRQTVASIAPGDLRAGQHFVGQVVFRTRTQGAHEACVGRRGCVQRARDVEYLLSTRPLKVPPKFKSSPHQRRVRRVFMICEAYDSRDAVGGSHVVDNAELFDAEHPLATLRQLIERGAPHAAKS